MTERCTNLVYVGFLVSIFEELQQDIEEWIGLNKGWFSLYMSVERYASASQCIRRKLWLWLLMNLTTYVVSSEAQ